jgi:ABC-type dipeptide/oligopeptide/nickel transport system permease component
MRMPRWLSRLLMLPVVVLGASVVLFITSRIVPGDPVNELVGDSAPQAVKQAIRQQLGLNQSLPVRYVKYVDGLIHGDFGTSIQFGLPVRNMLTQAFPATLELVLAGALVTLVVSLLLGLTAGIYHNKLIDTVCRFFAIITASSPPFFVGILAIFFFGFEWNLLPTSGRGTPPDIQHLILPALVLGLSHAGSTARLFRATIIDVMRQDYIRSARARGIAGRVIVFKYAFRNALIPAVADLSVSLADIIGSVILIETVFAWPGIGLMVEQGIQYNDFPVLTGAILVLLVYAMLVNFLADSVYGGIDPRVQLAAS